MRTTLIAFLMFSAGLMAQDGSTASTADAPSTAHRVDSVKELETAKAKIVALEKQLAELSDAPAIAQKWYESSASCQAALVRLQVQIDKMKPESPSKVKP